MSKWHIPALFERATTWCYDCQAYAKVTATQPYRDYTWRIECRCTNYECEERGILWVMEIKDKE